jgi:predicted nuclease of predicted toxin-antitoxin system
MDRCCVRLFIDESLSPRIAERLNNSGIHDAVHPLHVGRRGEPDHRVVAWCIEEDRIMVTQNARDFRRLIGKAGINPGLIILPSVDREGTWALLQAAIAYLSGKGEAADAIVNHVLEIDESGRISIFALPQS